MSQTFKRCPECYNSDDPNAKYCSQCAAPLSGSNQTESFIAGLSRHTNTIVITALATICCFLMVVLFAISKRAGESPQPAPKNFVSANASPNLTAEAAISTKNLSANTDKSAAPTSAKSTPKPAPTLTPEPDLSDSDTYGSEESDDYNSDYDDSTGRDYITGPRGGCYYINKNGNKTYVDRSMCGGKSPSSGTTSGRYIRGPRGGCYYVTGSGRKQYVDRSLCD